MPTLRIGLTPLGSNMLSATTSGQQATIFTGSFYDLGSAINLDQVVQVTPAQIDPATVIVSQDSAPAFHPTLFEDFQLRAEGVYNFYTEDERVSTAVDVSASIDHIPRYVWLRWNKAPIQRISLTYTKGIRPQAVQSDVVGPVLPIKDAKVSLSNGYIAPGAIQVLLVPPQETITDTRFDQDLFLSSQTSAGESAADYQHDSDRYSVTPIPEATPRIRVNFIDPSIAGAIDPGRVAVSTDHTHLATLGAFAKLAAGLEVISEFNQDVPTRNPPPKFPAPAQTPGLIYTGYVIERYTLDPSGAMTLSRTIDIDDVEQTRYIDREVVFGGRYAYRIRSIVQWTRPSVYGFTGLSTLDRLPVIDTAMSSPTRQASFYSGDWSDWARTEVADSIPPDPPDEVIVRPVSPKRQIHVNWRMPGDPQRDLMAIRLLRSVVRDGRYGDWVQLGEYVPGNGMYIDRDVEAWEDGQASYMYALYSVSLHGELSVLSERIEARLTDRSRYLGEEPVRQVGPRGDDPMAHARGPKVRPEVELVCYDRAVLYVRGGPSALPLFDRPYVAEVQSIATGQRVEVAVSVDSTDVEVDGGSVRA
jgi:hypothetical protein